MPTIPSLTSSFSALLKAAPGASSLVNAFKVPALSPTVYGGAFARPKNAASPFNIGGPAVPRVSPFAMTSPAVPNMSTPRGPRYAPPPAVPQGSNLQSGNQPTNTPAMPSIAVQPPQQQPTYAPPAYVRTPSGAMVDPSTGALVSPATTQQSAIAGADTPPITLGSNTGNVAGAAGYSGSAGGSPAIPAGWDVGTYANFKRANPTLEPDDEDTRRMREAGGADSLITSPESEALFKKYQGSLAPTQEELDAQTRLNALNVAASSAYTNTQNQPIALPFITGQQAALERSQANLAKPLESQIALLQAKRQLAGTASKAALDRVDAQLAAKRELSTKTVTESFGSTTSVFNPKTGKYEPIGGGGISSGDKATMNSWVGLIKSGQAQLSDVPQQFRQAVAEGLSSTGTVSKANTQAIEQADIVLGYIDKALPMISGWTTGVAGKASAAIPGTPAYNLEKTIDTIKANVGFAALQAMRNASPTGGALGQISERENTLLQSTLGSLDIGQSEEQLKENFAQVALHFDNLKAILSAPATSQVSYDKDGRVVIKAPTGGAFGATGGAAPASGSIYDF